MPLASQSGPAVCWKSTWLEGWSRGFGVTGGWSQVGVEGLGEKGKGKGCTLSATYPGEEHDLGG